MSAGKQSKIAPEPKVGDICGRISLPKDKRLASWRKWHLPALVLAVSDTFVTYKVSDSRRTLPRELFCATWRPLPPSNTFGGRLSPFAHLWMAAYSLRRRSRLSITLH
jgi:hypothetical protein